MNTQVISHKSRIVDYRFNFTANGEASWSFVAEGDGEIYAVESNNVASYTINGGSVTLPFALIAGNSYTVAITKTTGGQVADINLLARRSTDKQSTINVPDFSVDDGRYLFVSSNGILKKYDSNLLVASNYAGSGAWTSDPLIASYTMPDLSLEQDYLGDFGTIYWRSLAFITISGESYIFICGSHDSYNDVVGTLFKISDGLFYKTDLSLTGYTRLKTGFASNGVLGGIIYDYVNQKLLIRRTRAAGSSIYIFDIDSGSITTDYSLNSTYDNIINSSGSYVVRNGFDPISQEYVSGISRLKSESNANRNYMHYSNFDAKYIRSNGNVITYNANIISQRREYDSSGEIVKAYGGTGTASGNGGPIEIDDINDYILGVSSSGLGIIANAISTASGGLNYNMTMSPGDHNGFRGIMKSSYSGHAFSWGRKSTNSGKRLYVFDPSKRDSTIEVGYLDFADEINDIHSNQIL